MTDKRPISDPEFDAVLAEIEREYTKRLATAVDWAPLCLKCGKDVTLTYKDLELCDNGMRIQHRVCPQP